jgi:hypothetical protein
MQIDYEVRLADEQYRAVLRALFAARYQVRPDSRETIEAAIQALESAPADYQRQEGR